MSYTYFNAEVVTNHESGCGEVEIVWSVPFVWSRPIPATYLDPPEGGLEMDGKPQPIEIIYYPADAEDYTVSNIKEGSILDILIRNKYTNPTDEDCYDVASEELEARDEAAKEAWAESKLMEKLGK